MVLHKSGQLITKHIEMYHFLGMSGSAGVHVSLDMHSGHQGNPGS